MSDTVTLLGRLATEAEINSGQKTHQADMEGTRALSVVRPTVALSESGENLVDDRVRLVLRGRATGSGRHELVPDEAFH